MKGLLGTGVVALALALPACAWARCALNAEDLESLALSPAKIASQAQADALPPVQLDRLCQTRAGYHHHHDTHELLQGPSELSTRYLSPAEGKEYSAWLDDMFKHFVDEHPGTLDQRNLDQITGAIGQGQGGPQRTPAKGSGN